MNIFDSVLPRSILILVITRGLSSLGSTLTAFGLDVWVYRETGSYTIFALLSVLTTLPSLVFAPIAGVIADRWDKKRLLILCDVVSLATVLVTLVMYLNDHLNVSMVAISILALSLASEIRWSTLGPTISLMVPKEQLGQINGLQQAFRSATVMLGPVLGAIGLEILGLPWLLSLDILSYVASILGALAISISAANKSNQNELKFSNFWQELTYGFRWVFSQPALKRLLLFFMVINIGLSIFTATFVPYILSFLPSSMLGLCLGLQGAGGFLTGLFLTKWCRQRNHERSILGSAFCVGLCLFAWGINHKGIGMAAVAFMLGVVVTVIMVSSQTIWQTYVPIGIQGKVFSVRSMVSFGLSPISKLVSIPLVSAVFLPIVGNSTFAAMVWSDSQGGALGLMISMLGVGVMACTIVVTFRGGFNFSAHAPREIHDSKAA